VWQVQQQIRQLMDEMSPFITSLLEGTVDKMGGEKQGVSRKLQNKT